MRIRGLSWDKQAQASLPATTKAAFCSRWDPRGAPLLPPSSLVLASARKRGGKSHQWHHSGRRGGGRREGKSDSRDASYSDRLFFSFFSPNGFFWWQQPRICANEANRRIMLKTTLLGSPRATWGHGRHPPSNSLLCLLQAHTKPQIPGKLTATSSSTRPRVPQPIDGCKPSGMPVLS